MVAAVSAAAPALADTGYTGTGYAQAQEWWLGGLHVTQAWPSTEGAGITVAVLGTGIDAAHPDLAGSVTTGPDFSGSGRTAGGPFWGIDGTEVAGIIAGHGHGTGREDGILGVAPAAKILSIRVSLEFNDPLNSEAAIAGKLPAAIAAGITYAVDHGARIIDLPLDPGTAGLTGQGTPAAAGGSRAERAAVSYALSKNVLLVAPAGDDGQGPGLVDHPAAYAGVIAVGAVGRNGQVAPFSSRRSYVALTAPGVGLMTAVPPDGYTRVSSTSTSSGIVAGVAALIWSRYPHLTAAQVTRALTGSTGAGASTGRAGAPGAGRGTVDAGRAVDLAAAIVAASQPRPSATPSARPHRTEGLSTTAAHRAGAGALATSLVRYAVAGLGGLIVLVIALLLAMRRRRERMTAAADAGAARGRPRGQHEQRRPELGPVPGQFIPGPGAGGLAGPSGRPAPPAGSLPAGPAPAGPPATGWPAAGGWQGGSVAEMQLSSTAPFRPVMAPPPRAAKTTPKTPSASGPPWEPAPAPERTFGPLPAVANSAMPPDPGPGIRVPGDMAALPVVPPDMLPAPFDVTALPDADFPPRPAASDDPAADFPGRPNLMTRPGLGLAAAPVPADYAPPQAPDFTVPSRAAGLVLSGDTFSPSAPAAPAAPVGPEDGTGRPADPSFIWDLAATDVFPAAADPGPQTETPGPVPEDGEPGATADGAASG